MVLSALSQVKPVNLDFGAPADVITDTDFEMGIDDFEMGFDDLNIVQEMTCSDLANVSTTVINVRIMCRKCMEYRLAHAIIESKYHGYHTQLSFFHLVITP